MTSAEAIDITLVHLLNNLPTKFSDPIIADRIGPATNNARNQSTYQNLTENSRRK